MKKEYLFINRWNILPGTVIIIDFYLFYVFKLSLFHTRKEVIFVRLFYRILQYRDNNLRKFELKQKTSFIW